METEVLERIKHLRKKSGLTAAEVAEKMGFSGQGSYTKVELGKVELKLSHITRLAEVFGVSVGYMLGLEDKAIADQERGKELEDLREKVKEREATISDKNRIIESTTQTLFEFQNIILIRLLDDALQNYCKDNLEGYSKLATELRAEDGLSVYHIMKSPQKSKALLQRFFSTPNVKSLINKRPFKPEWLNWYESYEKDDWQNIEPLEEPWYLSPPLTFK